MNRFVPAAVVLLATFCSPASEAQRATDAEMARDALAPYVRSFLGPEERRAEIQQLHSIIQARSRSNPDELGTATVVFKRGMTVKQLAKVAEMLSLEIAGMNVKAPLNDEGIVQTLLIGTDALLRPKGSFEQRAEHAIGYQRFKFLEFAEALPKDEAKDLERMAKSPMRIYGCDVIGTVQSLSSLTSHPAVQLVLADPAERSEGKIFSYTNLKGEYEEAWQQLEESGPMQD